MRSESGQSLIEVAIAVPLLLLILIGIVDIGRVYYTAIALETGAQQGAVLAAGLSAPDETAIARRVCDASGFAAVGSPCPGLAVAGATIGAGGADATVDVTYDVDLIYAQVLRGLGGSGTVRLHAHATYPGIAP